jgi:hypothetical protein
MSKSKCQMSNDEQQECWNNGMMEEWKRKNTEDK